MEQCFTLATAWFSGGIEDKINYAYQPVATGFDRFTSLPGHVFETADSLRWLLLIAQQLGNV